MIAEATHACRHSPINTSVDQSTDQERTANPTPRSNRVPNTIRAAIGERSIVRATTHSRRWTHYESWPTKPKKAFIERHTDQQKAALAKWQSDKRWSYNQLCHKAAQKIRKKFGLESVQVILGHAAADITQVYAERDAEKAREEVRQMD